MIRSWDCVGCFSFPPKGKRIGLVFFPGVDADMGAVGVTVLPWVAGFPLSRAGEGGTSARRLGEGKGRTVLRSVFFLNCFTWQHV